MDKKFLSAEEALSQFGIDAAEFQKLVDEGELRALADRGSWRYRRDEIEQLIERGRLSAQNPQGDSGASSNPPEDFAFLEIDEQALEDGATAVNPRTDADFAGESSSPEIIGPDSDFASDGEIMLIESDPDVPVASLTPTPSSSDMPVAGSLSDLDIVIADAPKSPSAEATGQSSVISAGDHDSQAESDSDVKGAAADVPLAGTDPDVMSDASVITPAEASSIIRSDSDVRIADSGISLERGDSGQIIDSGISLNPDSGLTLETGDSGIHLEPDSGLSLEADADSGIALEGSDSGLSLTDADSGIALSGKQSSARPSRPDDTLPEFDQWEDSGDRTAMVESFDDSSAEVVATPAKGKKAKSPGLSDSFTMDDEVEDLEIVEDLEAGDLDLDSAAELEDEDILEASDEAFSVAESGELSDESSIASVPVMRTVAKEPSWGALTVIPIAVCAVLLLVQGLLLWDGLSTMWSGDTSQAIGASIIDSLGGLL